MSRLGAKRLGMWTAGILGGLAVVVVALSLLINRDAVRDAVAIQIHDATGLDLVMGDVGRVGIFPTGAVSFTDVRIAPGSDGTPAIAVAELTARLRFLPLLFRRYEIADLVLTRPVFHVARHADGTSNWDAIVGALTQTLRGRPGSVPLVSEIRIADGTLRYSSAHPAINETITGIDMSLAWPAIARSFGATGQARWRGTPIDLSLALGDIGALIAGERTTLRARLANDMFKVNFDGAAAWRPQLTADGTLTADAASLRTVMHWAGHDLPGDGGFRRFSLKARTKITDGVAALSDVNLELDGNTAEGVLAVVGGDRPALQGTLASDKLDLTPYLGTVQLLVAATRDWNRKPFDLRPLTGLDLDLRLSAARVTLGTSKLGRAALATNLRDGTLTLSIGEAQAYGGVLMGSFAIARSGDTTASVKAQFRLRDADLEPAATELFAIRRLSGRGDLSATLEASGSNVHALAQSLDGTLNLTARDGALNGFNVEQLLRRLERRPLSGAGDFRTGRTPFDRLIADFAIEKGIAAGRDLRFEGPNVRLVFTGTAPVAAREFDLKGIASLLASDPAQTFELPFVVQGPWDDPIVLPDPQALIRRSPASAPLLDSVRDRGTRDAVRSAIERLTGARSANPSAQEPATQEPTPQEPAAEQPATQEPSVQEPAAKESAAQGSLVNAPDTKDSAPKESAPEQPSGTNIPAASTPTKAE